MNNATPSVAALRDKIGRQLEIRSPTPLSMARPTNQSWKESSVRVFEPSYETNGRLSQLGRVVDGVPQSADSFYQGVPPPSYSFVPNRKTQQAPPPPSNDDTESLRSSTTTSDGESGGVRQPSAAASTAPDSTDTSAQSSPQQTEREAAALAIPSHSSRARAPSPSGASSLPPPSPCPSDSTTGRSSQLTTRAPSPCLLARPPPPPPHRTQNHSPLPPPSPVQAASAPLFARASSPFATGSPAPFQSQASTSSPSSASQPPPSHGSHLLLKLPFNSGALCTTPTASPAGSENSAASSFLFEQNGSESSCSSTPIPESLRASSSTPVPEPLRASSSTPVPPSQQPLRATSHTPVPSSAQPMMSIRVERSRLQTPVLSSTDLESAELSRQREGGMAPLHPYATLRRTPSYSAEVHSGYSYSENATENNNTPSSFSPQATGYSNAPSTAQITMNILTDSASPSSATQNNPFQDAPPPTLLQESDSNNHSPSTFHDSSHSRHTPPFYYHDSSLPVTRTTFQDPSGPLPTPYSESSAPVFPSYSAPFSSAPPALSARNSEPFSALPNSVLTPPTAQPTREKTPEEHEMHIPKPTPPAPPAKSFKNDDSDMNIWYRSMFQKLHKLQNGDESILKRYLPGSQSDLTRANGGGVRQTTTLSRQPSPTPHENTLPPRPASSAAISSLAFDNIEEALDGLAASLSSTSLSPTGASSLRSERGPRMPGSHPDVSTSSPSTSSSSSTRPRHFHIPSHRLDERRPPRPPAAVHFCCRCRPSPRDATLLEEIAVHLAKESGDEARKRLETAKRIAVSRIAESLDRAVAEMRGCLWQLEASSTPASQQLSVEISDLKKRTADEMNSYRAKAERLGGELAAAGGGRHSYIPSAAPQLQSNVDRFTGMLRQYGGDESPRQNSASNRMAVALYRFVPQTERELALNKGDIVRLRKEIDGNWVEGERNGKVGIFPASYVQEEQLNEKRERLRSIYPFTARNSNEISLKVGDILTFRRPIDDNWTEGTTAIGEIGIFPTSYVRPLEETGGDRARTPTQPAGIPPERPKTPHSLPHPFPSHPDPPSTRSLSHPLYPNPPSSTRPLSHPVSHSLYHDQHRSSPLPPFPHTNHSNPAAPPYQIQPQNAQPTLRPVAHFADSPLPPPQPPLPCAGTLIGKAPNMQNGHHPAQGEDRLKEKVVKWQRNHSGNRFTGSANLIPKGAETYRAIYPYTPCNEDELDLQPDDIVFVVEKCDDGWYIGTLLRTGQFGTFPGNFVEKH